jgi:MerR family redox-sensitive transcriptional activator SoxR
MLFLGVDPVLTIGEISRRSGVASSALRFYEERGLITSVRAASGHRHYPRSGCAASPLLSLPKGSG